MSKKYRSVSVYLLMSVLLRACADPGPGPAQVGSIDYFDGSPGQYLLERNGKPVPFGPFTPVFEGDRMTVYGDSIEIRLIVNEKTLTVSRKNSPLVLKQRGRAPTVFGNMFSWAGNFFNSLHSNEMRQAKLFGTIGRGGNPDRISSELLSFEPLVLMPGTRDIYLAWEGGTPPYRVIFSASAGMIEERRDLALPNVQMKAISLAPGDYKIAIRDANNRTFDTSFTVESAGTDIAPPASLESLEKSALPGEIKATLLAGWLAGRKEGYWRFEAYQRVAPYADGYSNARLLRNALENGVKVPYFSAN